MLNLLKSKRLTGLTPNILCRFALLLSLREGARDGEVKVDLDGSEFNATTLFGEHQLVYESLIQQVHGVLGSREMQSVVAAHIDAGVDQLKRIRSLGDLLRFDSSTRTV
jgi:DNA sulfur modification protein DndE